jgi:hypothetical protein
MVIGAMVPISSALTSCRSNQPARLELHAVAPHISGTMASMDFLPFEQRQLPLSEESLVKNVDIATS